MPSSKLIYLYVLPALLVHYYIHAYIVRVHDLIIHEMLRKKERQGNTTQPKDKATQHNLPKAVIFQRKTALGVHVEAPLTVCWAAEI